jgi:transposase
MEQGESSTKVAGIDAAKAKLDVAVHGLEDELQVVNDEAGFLRLAEWLQARRVGRVGIEATGGYERRVVAFLQARGLEVVTHQPAEVRAFARFKRIRAKNDRIDARVIAAATAQVETVRAACDPILQELAERLTAYEQAADLVAKLKTFLEHVSLADLKAQYRAQLEVAQAWKQGLAKDLLARLAQEPRLAARFRLLRSLSGFGPIVAASLVIRMPELGRLARGQAASLVGVAPFDRDTGASRGERHIFGGRVRPRRMLYLAALAAKRSDPAVRAFAKRLTAAGKKPKVVLVAVMRKLIEAANLVLGRGTPWVHTAPA